MGHFLSSLIGLVFLTVFGPHWWSVAPAVGTAIAVMMLTRTVHPPAVALIYNNVTREAAYPKYW
jgi:CBS-domain-containing membrane protein